MLKIAYLIDTISCDTAGTQKQLIETIKRLNRKQFEPYLICLRKSDWMAHNQLPCPCFVLDYRGFLKKNFPHVIKEFVSIIIQNKFHVIQTFFEDSIFVGFFTKLFCPRKFILLSSRRDIGLGKKNHPWYHSLFSLLLPVVNCYFDGIIANSEQVKLYVLKKEKISPKKIKVIRNGVALPRRATTTPQIFLAEAKKVIWIGMVASLTPVKRHDVLIRGASILRRCPTTYHFRILFLGSGPEKARLQMLIEELSLQNHIYFAGAVRDVPAYLQHIDIGVLCSDREGLSNAILEYMACGLPVIATSVGGNIELVDENNGFCVPPDDPEAVAIALQRLMADNVLREKMGAVSLHRIATEYSWDKTIEELSAYYHSLVNRKL